MNILLIGNLSDRKCGFQNFSHQTVTALRRAGHTVTAWDGVYSNTYARREAGLDPFFPEDKDTYDVTHVIWHPATMNHYSGVTALSRWPKGVLSVWNGCPAASCPFTGEMDIRWGVLGREPEHHQLWYPIPDWVDDLPQPNAEFTVGNSGVRGDGVGLITEICARRGWQTNLSDPAVWLTQEDEIRRLARSTVNVCWYGKAHDDRSGAAMVSLGARRPFLCNDVMMMTHLKPFSDVYFARDEQGDLECWLTLIEDDFQRGKLTYPKAVYDFYRWSRAVTVLEEGWQACRG